MSDTIAITRAELQQMLADTESRILAALRQPVEREPIPERMSPETASKWLTEQGYPISKQTLYSMKDCIPHEKFGGKLIFNPDSLLDWARNRSRKGRTIANSRGNTARTLTRRKRA